MPIISALSTASVRALQAGRADAYGHVPERHVSDGGGNPCRHCLKAIPEGEQMLVLAYRPFPDPQPYAETGPIFLCAEPCTRHAGTEPPEILTLSPDYLIKGYDADDRIVYGTGAITPKDEILSKADSILSRPAVAYLHVRSSRNNCYLARIDPSKNRHAKE